MTRTIFRAVAIGVMLAHSVPARAQSSSNANPDAPPRIMVGALVHPDTLSGKLLARVRAYLAASKAMTLVREKDVVVAIFSYPEARAPTLAELPEVAMLVAADAFVEVEADPAPGGVGGVALMGSARARTVSSPQSSRRADTSDPNRLRVDTLRAPGAALLDSVAKALAVQIVARAGLYSRR
jgi:hypothetical protein